MKFDFTCLLCTLWYLRKILSEIFLKEIFWNPSLSEAVIPEVCSVLVGEKSEGIFDGSVASGFHWDGADWINPFYTQTEAALYPTQQQTGSCLENLPFYIKIENKVLFWLIIHLLSFHKEILMYYVVWIGLNILCQFWFSSNSWQCTPTTGLGTPLGPWPSPLHDFYSGRMLESVCCRVSSHKRWDCSTTLYSITQVVVRWGFSGLPLSVL